MKLFSTDSPFYQFMTRLWDIVKLSLLWVLFSIPIVTIGPATIAVFSVTMKMIDDTEGYVAHQFWDAFKKNIRNGIPLGLLFVLCISIVSMDFQMLLNAKDGITFVRFLGFIQFKFGYTGDQTVVFVFGIIAAFIFSMTFVYAFPLSARYENTLMKTLRNSVDIATRYFLRTLALFVLLIIEFVLIFFNLTTLFVGLLIGPASVMLTISGFAVPFFRAIEKEDGAVTYPEEKKEEEDEP